MNLPLSLDAETKIIFFFFVSMNTFSSMGTGLDDAAGPAFRTPSALHPLRRLLPRAT